jgi:hypothetical protein
MVDVFIMVNPIGKSVPLFVKLPLLFLIVSHLEDSPVPYLNYPWWNAQPRRRPYDAL